MSNTISSGIYRFTNTDFSNKYVADLIRGAESGPICGFGKVNDSGNQKWKVQNIGSDKITIENVALPGYYATAPVHSNNVALIGSPNLTIWSAYKVSKGEYQFRTADGKYVWALSNAGDYAVIYLQSHSVDVVPTGSKWKVEAL